MNCFRLALLILLLPLTVRGQDISGSWEGNYTGTLLILKPRKLLVNITVLHDTIITGSSHLYHRFGWYEHYTISGIYHPGDATIYFTEDSVLSVKVGTGETCLGNYKMKLTVTDSSLRFEGRWKDNAGSSVFNCPSSGVWLEKKIPRKKAAVPKPPGNQLQRREAVQKLVEISQEERDSIRIELRDDAQIDNDVVSVYMDDSLVLYRQRLTATATGFYLSLKKGTTLCSIRMVAESMGSIPPCTALMTITTKNNRYTITLSSDAGNTGTLELFLRE